MNFKLKALVAAVVLSAAATSANAAIDLNAGNSEFAFSAWDSVAGVGYTYDLNWSKFLNDMVGIDQAATATGNATLLANAKVASSMIGANGVIFDDVLTGFNLANSSNVQWNLAAVDTSSGRTRMLTTQGDTFDAAFTSTSNQAKSAATAFSLYTSGSNGKVTVPGTDTFANTIQADGSAYAGVAGNNWNGNVADTTNVMGGTSFMSFLAQSTQASSSQAGLQQQLFSFDNKAIVAKTYLQDGAWRLQVAAVQAVPEPETNAMFLAGLGLMGFIARRRRNSLTK
ncbi:MAG: PEP-CTERM sorting domain-containing protein [Methylotenera sp.]